MEHFENGQNHALRGTVTLKIPIKEALQGTCSRLHSDASRRFLDGGKVGGKKFSSIILLNKINELEGLVAEGTRLAANLLYPLSY